MDLRAWRETERLWLWFARRDGEERGVTGSDLWRETQLWVRDQMKEAGAPSFDIAPWQHDHIRPLVEAHGDIEFWKLTNVQTLCSSCHVEKGREDNARHRAIKAPVTQMALL